MYQLAHIGIAVSDLTRSLEFYTSILKCVLNGTKEMENLKIAYLQLGDQTLELLQYDPDSVPERQNGHYDHIALRVNDLDNEMAKLSNCGIVFLADAPRLTPWGQKIIFFTGPDGERIELVEG